MLSFSVFSLILIILSFTVFGANDFSKQDFPPGFIFGSGTSAYQVEGAANQDGRTPSIWDTFAHDGKMQGATGDIACDGYHKYKEDVQLMMDVGLEAYRFSISWSRLIPNGRGPINPKGLHYYNSFINELIDHGIEPHVTLHHCDLPQALDDEYGGWAGRKIVKDFTDYADVCFREFGDRVLHWTTMNEPNVFTMSGYDSGILPPQRCSAPFGAAQCVRGNSSTEPYLAAYHFLLAHASAASLYKNKYKDIQHGFVGFNIFAYSLVPATNATEDVVATQRANDFFHGWFLHPLWFGDYPEIMKENAGSRIPSFTSNESKLVKGSCDFIGVNYYAMSHVEDNSDSLKMEDRDFSADMAVHFLYGKPVNETQLPFTPWGIQRVLEYIKQGYGNPPIYIHENGYNMLSNSSVEDWPRVKFLQGHIGSLLDAIRNGSNTKGYFIWSFLDVLEMFGGFESTYGLFYVDFKDPNLTRYPKLSARWYSEFLKGKSIGEDKVIQIASNSSALSGAHYLD